MGLIIDYNELWKLYARSRHVSRAGSVNSEKFWDKLADHYDLSVRKNYRNTERDLMQLDLKPEYTVLDIGAGNGRLSVPIARYVKWVTAVEPSVRMFRHLKTNMKEAGVENYTCINTTWEDAPVPEDRGKFDVVISAFALEFLDLRKALEKMDSAALKKVYIFWFAGRKHDDGLIDYIRMAGGNTFIKDSGLPDYLCVLNILHDMGIYADLNIKEYEWEYPYDDIGDAVSHALKTGKIDEEDRDLAYEYYGRMLTDDPESGRMILKTTADQALISWEK